MILLATDLFAVLFCLCLRLITGTDLDGCKEIIQVATDPLNQPRVRFPTQTAAEALHKALTQKGEAQFGKTKIFIRKPETFFCFEKLRDECMGDIAAVIQRAWRRFHMKRESLTLQMRMSEWYAAEGKSRRRDSLCRPFGGDYLDNLGAGRAEKIRDALYRLFDHYEGVDIRNGTNRITLESGEQLLFADADCGQVVKASSSSTAKHQNHAVNGGKVMIQRRILVLTEIAIYLLDFFDEKQEIITQKMQENSSFRPPLLTLRRRIPLMRSGTEFIKENVILMIFEFLILSHFFISLS